MSLTQDIATMVQAANNLTQEVVNKMGQIDSQVEKAKTEFADFQSTADDRYMMKTQTPVFVDGERDKFYPVFINTSSIGIARLQITRGMHDDKHWAGSLTSSFLIQNGSWGTYPNIMILDFLISESSAVDSQPEVTNDGFIADFINGGNFVNGGLFWLRGGYTYQVTSSLKNYITVVTHEDLVTAPNFDVNTIRVFKSGFDITYNGVTEKAVVLVERNAAKIPSLHYVRGL